MAGRRRPDEPSGAAQIALVSNPGVMVVNDIVVVDVGAENGAKPGHDEDSHVMPFPPCRIAMLTIWLAGVVEEYGAGDAGDANIE